MPGWRGDGRARALPEVWQVRIAGAKSRAGEDRPVTSDALPPLEQLRSQRLSRPRLGWRIRWSELHEPVRQTSPVEWAPSILRTRLGPANGPKQPSLVIKEPQLIKLHQLLWRDQPRLSLRHLLAQPRFQQPFLEFAPRHEDARGNEKSADSCAPPASCAGSHCRRYSRTSSARRALFSASRLLGAAPRVTLGASMIRAPQRWTPWGLPPFRVRTMLGVGMGFGLAG